MTGGGSGIGQAAVYLLGEAGCNVSVADLNTAGGAAVVGAIEPAGGRAQFVLTDVSDESSVQRMVNSAVAAYGRLDGACNAAGIPQRGKLLHDVTLEEWDHCIAVNLRGLFICNKYQIAAMLETGGGSIVNIASTAAMVGFPNAGEYCASKAGVMGLVRGAAVDETHQGATQGVLQQLTLSNILA